MELTSLQIIAAFGALASAVGALWLIHVKSYKSVNDGQKITLAYLTKTPVGSRDVNELAQLLARS